MKSLKVLNLYAGIGGNRKLWPKNIKVVAIEINPEIARAYKHFFPEDEVIVTDAHDYLEDNHDKYDFIWSSRPCQSHTLIRKNVAVKRGQSRPIYPDMKLYEEIIFLQHYAKCKWVVENVKSYYQPLIRPQESGGHYFWSNFHISYIRPISRNIEKGNNRSYLKRTGFDLSGFKFGKRKDTVYHNCLNQELGLHVFNSAFKTKQLVLV